jgi:hypothetical protein
MRSSPKPVTLRQIAAASSSAGRPSSPLKTVMTSRLDGTSYTLVSSSQANAIASSLK